MLAPSNCVCQHTLAIPAKQVLSGNRYLYFDFLSLFHFLPVSLLLKDAMNIDLFEKQNSVMNFSLCLASIFM